MLPWPNKIFLNRIIFVTQNFNYKSVWKEVFVKDPTWSLKKGLREVARNCQGSLAIPLLLPLISFLETSRFSFYDIGFTNCGKHVTKTMNSKGFVSRLTRSWQGEVLTPLVFLLSLVVKEPYQDARCSVVEVWICRSQRKQFRSTEILTPLIASHPFQSN